MLAVGALPGAGATRQEQFLAPGLQLQQWALQHGPRAALDIYTSTASKGFVNI